MEWLRRSNNITIGPSDTVFFGYRRPRIPWSGSLAKVKEFKELVEFYSNSDWNVNVTNIYIHIGAVR